MTTAPPLPTPDLLGLPENFDSWRRNQAEAVIRAMDSPKRFVVLGMPTGFGKSLVYMACAKLGDPTVILTSTKGLQSQLIKDFASSGLTDIRGMNNYECIEGNSGQLFKTSGRPVSCDEGACLSGWQCPQAAAGCLYFDAQRDARAADCTVTNYPYWMGVNASADVPPLGKRGLLVLDEAHGAIDELGDHLAVEVGHWETEGLLGQRFPQEAVMEEWREWARTVRVVAASVIIELSAEIRQGRVEYRNLRRLRELRDLERRMATICGGTGQWVHEETRDRKGRKVVRFDPVWSGEYAETSLFLRVPKVVLTSATIRPKTLELLGIGVNDYEFLEYPSSFPIPHRPVIHVPTVRVRHDTHPGHMRQWVARVDQIIAQRLDRKGVVHTVSYRLRDYLLRFSEHARHMVVHDSGGLQDAVSKFRSMPPPAVLVSPSVGTGFDFPDADCRYQIIGKVPFPDSRSLVLKARQERDADFFAYVAAQNLVQMAGRGVRSTDDWCETLIIDDNWSWFFGKYKKFMPRWFTAACSKSNSMAAPGPINFPEKVGRNVGR